MGNLSKHFDKEEFACKDGCGLDSIHPMLIDVLEDVREHFGVPVKINSGCRCREHNKAVGGETHSYHLLCQAADIDVKNVSPHLVYEYLNRKYSDKFGLGLYKSWVHVDIRSVKGRWRK